MHWERFQLHNYHLQRRTRITFKKPHLSLTKKKHELHNPLISKGSTVYSWECSKERGNEEEALQKFWITSPCGSRTPGTRQKTPMKSKHFATKRLWFPWLHFNHRMGKREISIQGSCQDSRK